MSAINEARHYRLSSGLEVNLQHVPHLRRAAVVWIFPVGSHQEPKEWPGLAHLTEHMVFSGGRQFREQQRLMPWVQQRGGRINATTQQNYTAYYFEVDPADLSQGLLRLTDMLTAPRFAVSDLLRETAVIDEEYRLYSASPHALASAALHSQITHPVAFADFHIGNLETFGKNTTTLGDALERFYSSGYNLNKSQVWIASPLDCQQQYVEVSGCFAMTDDPVIVVQQPRSRVAESELIRWQNWQGEIRLAKQPGLGITLVLANSTLSDWPVLVELMTDNAPGSLSQVISHELGHYLSMRVERHYHDNQQIFFTLWIEGADFSDQDVKKSLGIWQQWLAAVSRISPKQFGHYHRLAQARALQLPAMDFLREHALGFLFTASAEGELKQSRLQHALSSIKSYALLRSRRDTPTQEVECQGLYCQFRASMLDSFIRLARDYSFIFYPQLSPKSAIIEIPPNSGRQVPLHYDNDLSRGVRIVLRPAAGAAISDTVREALTQALSPVFSLAKHAAGKVTWQQVSGNDLLYIRFDHFADLKDCMLNLITYWPSVLPTSSIESYAALSLKELLQNMPSLLADNLDRWTVSYSGPTQRDADSLQAMLSALPINWHSLQPDRFPLQRTLHYTSSGSEQATLIAFIPYKLISPHSLTVYHQLAGYYESAFYHQLREVEAVGYAVACRQRVYRDRWGLQIILQSSHLSAQQLYDRVWAFFDTVTLSDEALAKPSPLENESSGDNEVDEYLMAHFPLQTADKQHSETTDFSLEMAHAVLVEQVKDKQGGWIFLSKKSCSGRTAFSVDILRVINE